MVRGWSTESRRQAGRTTSLENPRISCVPPKARKNAVFLCLSHFLNNARLQDTLFDIDQTLRFFQVLFISVCRLENWLAADICTRRQKWRTTSIGYTCTAELGQNCVAVWNRRAIFLILNTKGEKHETRDHRHYNVGNVVQHRSGVSV